MADGFSRPQYQRIAAILEQTRPDRLNTYAPKHAKAQARAAYASWHATAVHFARCFAFSSPAFQADRFLAACGMDEEGARLAALACHPSAKGWKATP